MAMNVIFQMKATKRSCGADHCAVQGGPKTLESADEIETAR